MELKLRRRKSQRARQIPTILPTAALERRSIIDAKCQCMRTDQRTLQDLLVILGWKQLIVICSAALYGIFVLRNRSNTIAHIQIDSCIRFFSTAYKRIIAYQATQRRKQRWDIMIMLTRRRDSWSMMKTPGKLLSKNAGTAKVFCLFI